MPQVKNALLTDREKQYLNNPDDFDSQTSAEISYTIRKKWEELQEDIELMSDENGVWCKKKTPEKASNRWCIVEYLYAGEIEIKQCYIRSHRIDDDYIRRFEGMDEMISLKRDSVEDDELDEVDIDESYTNYNEMMEALEENTDSFYTTVDYFTGFKPESYNNPDVIEQAKETGRLPNPVDGVEHKVTSQNCIKNLEKIPVGSDEFDEIREHCKENDIV